MIIFGTHLGARIGVGFEDQKRPATSKIVIVMLAPTCHTRPASSTIAIVGLLWLLCVRLCAQGDRLHRVHFAASLQALALSAATARRPARRARTPPSSRRATAPGSPPRYGCQRRHFAVIVHAGHLASTLC